MSLRVIHDAPLGHKFAFNHKNDYWTHLVASDPESKTPIRIGSWKHVGESTEESEEIVAEYDEAKYVVSGEITLLDVASKTEHTATEGSLIWIEKGSKGKILRIKDLVTVEAKSQPNGPSTDAVLSERKGDVLNPNLDVKLAHLLKTYAVENSKSEAAYKLATQTLPGGNTRSVLAYSPFPLVLKSGQQCYVTSLDGKEYVDFVSEYSAGIYGHSHPTLQAAVQEALKIGINLGGLTEHEATFGRLIQRRFPSLERVRFCNSGTEANQMAIAVAKFHTQRKSGKEYLLTVVVFKNGYHGGTLSFHHEYEPMNIPHNFIVAPYNDIEGTRSLLTDRIAAILVEPVLGAGGCIPGKRDHDIEITLSWNPGYFNIIPDMTTLGKYLGGGFTFGAFGGKQEIMERFNLNASTEAGVQSLTHSGTFNNNIFTMTAGIAASKLLTEDIFAQMNGIGDLLRNGINRIANENGWGSKLEATGFGSLVGVHFRGPESEVLLNSFFFYLLGHGLYIGKRGFFSINMIHEEKHVGLALQAIEGFVKEFAL
ncbi:pyridoxal phosphate-dependent transferase [Bisporella sp. PMI_857]|nr:pyridoxal phosphate-dependent transferase [Bisporella sp. PMI_857]